MERLGAQDVSFLYVESETNHMHIASVAIFGGPPPRAGEIEEMIDAKLHLLPRYRQTVRFVPFEVARPVWCDDPYFNLGYHIRHSALPGPGSEQQLRDLVGRVMSQQLDRAKPLWEAWVIEGLDGNRWAMLSKNHHCMVDGVSGSDLLSVVMDHRPDAEHAEPVPFSPMDRPSDLSLLIDGVADTLTKPRETLQALRTTLRTPRRLLNEARDLVDGLATFRSFSKAGAESSLNGPIGPHRRWGCAATTIPKIKKIRAAHGGTVNDVVLAVITRGFRDLLLSRGEPIAGRFVRSLVPVSVRSDDERGTYNNRVSAMFAELPVGIADPVERLHALRDQMQDLKRHHQAVAAETLTSLTGFAPPALLALGARLLADVEQHSVQTVTTNVPGPQQVLYAAGRPMLAAYPYVPLFGSVRIGVAIFSYAGHLTFGVTGDYDSTADLDVLCRGIETGVTEMLASA